MRAHISLLAFVLTALTTTAQRTWIVDEHPTAIADFTDIESAVKAAQSGDTILVRRGSYAAPTVTVGIKLIGEPGAELDNTTSMLQVRDLEAGETFVLAGFTTRSNNATRLSFTDNRGRIFVENVLTLDSPTGMEQSPGITILDSDFVCVNRCKIYGTPGVAATRSRVVLNDCTINGVYNWKGRTKGYALKALDSRIDISQPYFRGASHLFGPLASAAVFVSGGSLTLAGDGTAYLEGGIASPTYRAPAIEADRGTVRYDSDIQLNPSSPKSTAIIGTALFIPESMVALSATGPVARSNELSATARGPAFAPAILLISLPTTPVLTSFGTLWLEVGSSFLLGSDFLDESGLWSTSYSVPHNLAKGLTATLQVFVDDGNRLMLSLPAMIVSH